MRNTLLFTSIIFLAIACKREEAARDEMGREIEGREIEPAPRSDQSMSPGAGDTSAGGGVSGAGTTSGTTGTTGTAPSAGTTAPGMGTGAPDTTATAPSGSTMSGQPGAGMSGQPGTSAQAGAGAQGAAGSMQAMSCDQLLPQNVRDQHLANTTVTSASPAASGQANCRIQGGELAQPGSIQAACNQATSATAAQLRQQNPDSREVANVGKAAVIVDQGQSQHLIAIDDDSNCQIDVLVPKNVDAVAIGRAALDNLPGPG